MSNGRFMVKRKVVERLYYRARYRNLRVFKMRILQRAWIGYNQVLQKHTFIVQSVQTSFLLGFGDFAAQKFIEPQKNYDYLRTLRFSMIGLALGPTVMGWLKILDKIVGKEQSLKTSFKKVAIDQLLFAPAMLAVFMTALNFLEGKTLEDLKEGLREDYVHLIKANWVVWPAFQTLNFLFIPLNFRVLVTQIVALAWNTFSLMGLGLGPGLMLWYRTLDRFVGSGKSLKYCVKKVVLDQFIFSPPFLLVFIGTHNFLEGGSYGTFKIKVQQSYVDIILNNWKFWPAVQIFNFTLVPLKFRVLVVQIAALGWNTYLAWKLHKN